MLDKASQIAEAQERGCEHTDVNAELAKRDVIENRFVGVSNRIPTFGRFHSLLPFVIRVFHVPNIIHTGVSVNG